MFNEKTQNIYMKYLQLLSDFADEYADELPERTKVKFQKSLTKYFDTEIAEAIKHEKFMLHSKDILFKRLLKAERKLRRLPTITEQEVRKSLAALGLQEDVSDELVRQTVLGFSQTQEGFVEEPEQVDEPSDVEEIDEVVDKVTFEDVVAEEPEPVSEEILGPVEVTTPEQVEKNSYWKTRRKDRTGKENTKNEEAVE